MVRVKGNPFQLEQGEYHSLLDDSNRSGKHRIGFTEINGTNSGAQHPYRPHTRPVSGCTVNTILLVVLVIFFAFLYNGEYFDSDENSPDLSSSSYYSNSADNIQPVVVADNYSETEYDSINSGSKVTAENEYPPDSMNKQDSKSTQTTAEIDPEEESEFKSGESEERGEAIDSNSEDQEDTEEYNEASESEESSDAEDAKDVEPEGESESIASKAKEAEPEVESESNTSEANEIESEVESESNNSDAKEAEQEDELESNTKNEVEEVEPEEESESNKNEAEQVKPEDESKSNESESEKAEQEDESELTNESKAEEAEPEGESEFNESETEKEEPEHESDNVESEAKEAEPEDESESIESEDEEAKPEGGSASKSSEAKESDDETESVDEDDGDDSANGIEEDVSGVEAEPHSSEAKGNGKSMPSAPKVKAVPETKAQNDSELKEDESESTNVYVDTEEERDAEDDNDDQQIDANNKIESDDKVESVPGASNEGKSEDVVETAENEVDDTPSEVQVQGVDKGVVYEEEPTTAGEQHSKPKVSSESDDLNGTQSNEDDKDKADVVNDKPHPEPIGNGTKNDSVRNGVKQEEELTSKGNAKSNDMDVVSAETETRESTSSLYEEHELQSSSTPIDKIEAKDGFKPPPRVLSEKYERRAKQIDDGTRQKLAEVWGSWKFNDPKSSQRPTHDYFAEYVNRDVPRAVFPDNAWQTDPEYLSKFLPESIALVKRAMEAILSEYGHGKEDEPDLDFEERSKMFQLIFTDDLKENDQGGTTDERSFNGLVRRVLHAVMTEGTFVLVMGGHSAAAGHGNHFQQSYTLQFQRVMEPVFARLGVQCIARNIGMGGLGTSQNALAAGAVYGNDIDVLVWDSGMTEREHHVIDMFMRQGLISGKKVPMLWGGNSDILKRLHEYADADVGMFGTGLNGVPKTTSLVQALDLPWAVRYLNCENDLSSECRARAYNGTCWIARDDFEPKTKQRSEPDGRAKWHPGNKQHQIVGRVLAFAVLTALEKGLSKWNSTEKYALNDSAWHVSSYYDNIRQKAMTAVPKQGSQDCYDMALPDRVCSLPINGRTEFTPRAYPERSSIRSIVKQDHVSHPYRNIYDPPDIWNPHLDVPDGAIDYLNIVENGNEFAPLRARRRSLAQLQSTQDDVGVSKNIIADVEAGKGWGLDTKSAADLCDGSYDSFCGRSYDNDCLLYGHNDFRGGLVFDSLSGWLVMNLKEMTHGIIMLKIEDWHGSGTNEKTNGWKCENNADNCPSSRRQLSTDAKHLRGNIPSVHAIGGVRNLKPAVPEYCKDFAFEFAINGNITKWNLNEWNERMIQLQRVVQIWTLLDDENFQATGGEGGSQDVELAIRASGCDRIKTFYLTHVYWA